MIEINDLRKILEIFNKYEQNFNALETYIRILYLEDYNRKHKNNQNKDLKRLMKKFQSTIIKCLQTLIKKQNNTINNFQVIYYANVFLKNNIRNDEIEELFKLHKKSTKILNKCSAFLNLELTYNLIDEQNAYTYNRYSEICIYIMVLEALYSSLYQNLIKIDSLIKCMSSGINTNMEIQFNTQEYEQNLNEIKKLIYKKNND